MAEQRSGIHLCMRRAAMVPATVFINSALMKALFVSLLLVGCLLGCANPGPVPVVERAQPPSERINYHWVSTGETLYAIAWRYNMDTRQLARANGLASPYYIRAGQKLTLDLSHRVSTPKVLGRSDRERVAVKDRMALPKSGTSKRKVYANVVNWRWPTKGTVTKQYRNMGNAVHNGVDIKGKRGQPVYAANHGVVVYAGSGLPAYGKLLIVKHNDTYLSAYAHNSKLTVAEGDNVTVGQKIAEIGKSGTTYEHLHFEIRKRGVPVDPLSLLPRA